MTTAIGVDGCRAGWVGVVDDGDRCRTVVAATVAELIDGLGAEVVAIDIPIGLLDSGTREAETLARQRVGARRSSVFPSPLAATLDVNTYAEAREVSRAIHGKALSAQAFALVPKIREVRDLLASRPDRPRIVEVHPEVSFAALAGQPLDTSKHTPDGLRRRRALLREVGLQVDADELPRGVAEDDLLDAAAAAWTARRVLADTAERLPPEPAGDDAPAIWV